MSITLKRFQLVRVCFKVQQKNGKTILSKESDIILFKKIKRGLLVFSLTGKETRNFSKVADDMAHAEDKQEIAKQIKLFYYFINNMRLNKNQLFDVLNSILVKICI